MEAFEINQERIMEDLVVRVRSALHILDPKVASEYREAVRFAPTLVEEESRVIDFLRTEDHHTLRAAERIALYWKARKEIFGEDRWLTPMSMSGAGTLTPDQVELLRSGYNTQTRSTVFLSNHSRLPDSVTCVDPAIAFYILSVTTREELQTQGSTLFHVIAKGNARDYERLPPATARQLRDCLPVRIKNIVVGRTFDPGREHLLDFLTFAVQGQSSLNLGMSAEIITGDSIKSTLDALEARGVDPAFVPLEMGGDYSYSLEFDSWVRHRLTVEGAMDGAPPVRNAEAARRAERRARDEDAKPAARSSGARHTSETATNETTTSRDESTMVVSTARVAAAAAAAAAASRAGGHASHNDGHSEDEGRSTTSSGGGGGEVLVRRRPGESKEDFERRRTHVYGKRFHAKRKQEISVMQEDCRALRETNQALRTDNARLERLVMQARSIVEQYNAPG